MSRGESAYVGRVTGWPAMQPELNDDHVALICSVLHQHRVAFVVIGGVAARLHETGHSTIDVDICPSRTSENLRRLSQALVDLDARLRVEGVAEGLAFGRHPDALAKVTTLTLVTNAGPLDLCFAPAAFPDGYETLEEGAVTIEVGPVGVRIAALSDVIASKRAAGRPKDIIALPILEARLREIEERACDTE